MDIVTLLLISFFVIIAIIKIENEKNGFFNLDYTTTWKGISCIVVIFVHIPNAHGNKIQDLVGSFGYICVTLFFLFSGYGLKWSLENKRKYLDNFIRNRISVLLLPFFIMNIISTVFRFVSGQYIKNNIVLNYLGLSSFSFVHVLLLFYVSFFIVYRHINVPRKFQDLIMYSVVVVYSFLGGFFKFGFGWHVESLGFLYGIACCDFMKKIDHILDDRYVFKTFSILLMSVVLGVCYLLLKNIMVYGDYLLRIFLGLSIITFFMFVTKKIRIGNLITKFLGEIAYEVFLSHGFIMMLISLIIINGLGINLTSGVYILLTIIFTIIFSYILHYVNSRLIRLIRA